MNQKNTLHRLFEFAESCKGLLTGSVVFAVLGAGFGIIPYIAVSRIIIQICAGDYSLKAIILMAVIALLGYLLQLCLSTISTIRSQYLFLCSAAASYIRVYQWIFDPHVQRRRYCLLRRAEIHYAEFRGSETAVDRKSVV